MYSRKTDNGLFFVINLNQLLNSSVPSDYFSPTHLHFKERWALMQGNASLTGEIRHQEKGIQTRSEKVHPWHSRSTPSPTHGTGCSLTAVRTSQCQAPGSRSQSLRVGVQVHMIHLQGVTNPESPPGLGSLLCEVAEAPRLTNVMPSHATRDQGEVSPSSSEETFSVP